MKRSSKIHKSGIRTGDLEKDLTPEQFGLIGRIAIAYNECEILVQLIYGACFGATSKISEEFISRTNGLESTVVLARKAIREFDECKEHHADFDKTLEFFMELKRFRDAVVHSRMFHVPAGIGKGSLNKGSQSEVLLTEKALQGLYDRLLRLHEELLPFILIVLLLHQLHMIRRFAPDQLAQRKKIIEPMLQVVLPQYLESQDRRRSLAPLPTFPDLQEDQQGLDINKIISELLSNLEKLVGT